MRLNKNIFSIIDNTAGIAAIYVVLILVVILGIAAFAIDVGYHRVVRNQLQNAADAAALAGCNLLYDRDPSLFTSIPNWAAATTEANNTIVLNEADNSFLISGTVWAGWWDTTLPWQPDQWQAIPNNSPSPPNPTQNYGPAVRATIQKTSGQNYGPISNFFGSILGISTTDVGASATAVAASPGSVRPGALAPVAISSEAANQYTNYDDPNNLIKIGSPYMYPNSLAGQWTSFNLDTNNVPDVRDLIENGNSTMLSIGDMIWIQPGVKDTLFDSTQQPSIENNYAGIDIVFPIVNSELSEVTHSEVPISGFIGFHVVCAGKGCNNQPGVGNNEKIIMGYFTTAANYGNGPVGTNYGPVDNCRLCR